MENKKLTAKLGNWQETVAMQALLGGAVYDPRDRASGALTKLRVIEHSDQVAARDYKSTLNDDCQAPQKHRDYVASDEKGPRQLRMEALMQAKIDEEEKQMDDRTKTLNNERFMVTTSQADFNGQDFISSTLGAGARSGSQMKSLDPYYVKDAAITYYLHTALHGSKFDFPATPIGHLNNIWLKGTSFTQGMSAGYGKKSETFENTAVPPTIRELQLLKKLRYDVVAQCAQVSPEGCPGAAVQTLTQKLLDLDNPAGRAPVDEISRVLSLYTGIELTVPHLDAVVVAFSRMNDERIILIEFIEYIRGALSTRSRELVFRVWDLVNPEEKEFVTDDELTSAMRCGAGAEEASRIIDSLHLYSCGRDEGYDVVDLVEYYRDVYAEVGDDETFEALLRDTWNM